MTAAPERLKAAAHSLLGASGYARASTFAAVMLRRLRHACWLIGPAARANRSRLAELHDLYRGRRCFVLGGGPSLTQMDLSFLREELTIGSNAIFLLFEHMGFRPTFYTVEDILVAEDRAREINALRGMTKLVPIDLAYCLRPDPCTVYVNFLYRYEGCPRFSADLGTTAYWGGTVTFLNLQLAYYLGCREVYLLGVDHSYAVPEDRDGTVIVSRTADVNHFHPNYFGPGYRWHDPRLDRMEAAYECARRFGEQNGMRILNATVGGRLEIFPRVDYATLFDQKELPSWPRT